MEMERPLPTTIRLATDDLKARLRARFGDRLLRFVLFGSRAWGEPRPDSDVDVCVVIDGLTRAEYGVVCDLAGDVCVEHLVDVAPLIYSGERFREYLAMEHRLARDIVERGVPL